MSSPETKSIGEQQATDLAASLDSAADDLERNGAVSSDEVRRTLLTLFEALATERAAE